MLSLQRGMVGVCASVRSHRVFLGQGRCVGRLGALALCVWTVCQVALSLVVGVVRVVFLHMFVVVACPFMLRFASGVWSRVSFHVALFRDVVLPCALSWKHWVGVDLVIQSAGDCRRL